MDLCHEKQMAGSLSLKAFSSFFVEANVAALTPSLGRGRHDLRFLTVFSSLFFLRLLRLLRLLWLRTMSAWIPKSLTLASLKKNPSVSHFKTWITNSHAFFSCILCFSLLLQEVSGVLITSTGWLPRALRSCKFIIFTTWLDNNLVCEGGGDTRTLSHGMSMRTSNIRYVLSDNLLWLTIVLYQFYSEIDHKNHQHQRPKF